jgi:splicing factor 3A subunit 1
VGLIARLSKDLVGDEAPLADSFTVPVAPRLTASEVDTIKLTARFAALNGRQFLSALALREIRNPEFDFLKTNHVLFPFFKALVDAYGQCLKPSKELTAKLSATLSSRNGVLQRCVHKLNWQRKQERERQDRESRDNEDKIAYHSIDWHDFVVVEVITFDDDDEALPAPEISIETSNIAAAVDAVGLKDREETEERAKRAMADAQAAARAATAAAAAAAAADAAAAATAAAEEKSKRSSDQPDAKRSRLTGASVAVTVDDDDDIVVRKDYRAGLAAAAAAAAASEASAPRFFLDPRTGRQIPISESEEHMRIELLDPKWKEQQKRALETQATSQFAADEQIAANLAMLGRQRPDIFGGDELQVRQKQKEADKAAARVIWDGHTSTVKDVQKAAMEKQKEELKRKATEQPKAPSQPAIGPAASRPAGK